MSRRLIEPMRLHDVVVVGARCAGAATAMLLAAAGHDVLLVDRDTFPSDTLSTHAIARSGVVQLNRWGCCPTSSLQARRRFARSCFAAATPRSRATVKDRLGVDMLIAPRRHILDSLLIDAAVSAGAQLVTGVTVDGVRRSTPGECPASRPARPPGRSCTPPGSWLVPMDEVRVSPGQSEPASPRYVAKTALLITHTLPPTGRRWNTTSAIGRSRASFRRTTARSASGCALRPTSHFTPDAPMCRLTQRSMRCSPPPPPSCPNESAPPRTRRSTARGIIGMPNQVRQAFGPGWALVGDAGYHRDAVTGHGISDAFRDAELLAVALDRARAAMPRRRRPRRLPAAARPALREIFEITCGLGAYPVAERSSRSRSS